MDMDTMDKLEYGHPCLHTHGETARESGRDVNRQRKIEEKRQRHALQRFDAYSHLRNDRARRRGEGVL